MHTNSHYSEVPILSSSLGSKMLPIGNFQYGSLPCLTEASPRRNRSPGSRHSPPQTPHYPDAPSSSRPSCPLSVLTSSPVQPGSSPADTATSVVRHATARSDLQSVTVPQTRTSSHNAQRTKCVLPRGTAVYVR